MYELISVTKLELKIKVNFFLTKKEAIDAMAADIIANTEYNNLNEVIEDANAGLCGFSDDNAWAETHREGIGYWEIIKVLDPDDIIFGQKEDANFKLAEEPF